MKFEELPLHDAVLIAISYEWESARVILTGKIVSSSPKSFVLAFDVASLLEVPHDNEWGFSSSINELSCSKPIFNIHMQSGDIIKIKAEGFNFATKHT